MRKKILIADDDPVVRLLLDEFLSPTGLEVETVDSGAACLRRVSEQVPDLLIVDFMMPDMTGADVIKSLRSDKITEKLPVIMLSASISGDDMIPKGPSGPDRFIEKPFESKTLRRAVEELLRSP